MKRTELAAIAALAVAMPAIHRPGKGVKRVETRREKRRRKARQRIAKASRRGNR